MGATKEDFDSCVAIRTSAIDNATSLAAADLPLDPTSSEELVTLR